MAAVEAVLFAHGEPIEADKLAAAAEIEKETVERIVERLNDRYCEQGSALTIGKLGNGFQMMTRPEFARYIKTAMETRRQVPLSPAALEVLAIVAYNQPVTRGFIDQVRGVDSSGVVRSLVERELLEEHGRLNDVPGRPIAYRTTDTFLRCFGLSSLEELPPIPGSTDQIDFDEYEETMNYGDDEGGEGDETASDGEGETPDS
ncbi:MAG: SMC-Scp complex subunit ScpB [Lachnospiraceae bacterium]|nr:SMC-Scp complex subunit ScpB [Ruminococcus sp.]MCM1274205.1 SMC-Scp complex subunit ScpB [Lachnospiraceae bacterium]